MLCYVFENYYRGMKNEAHKFFNIKAYKTEDSGKNLMPFHYHALEVNLGFPF